MPQSNFNNPAALTQDNQVRILLAAYQKNATELLAIEASQEKLISLVLGIYSVGITLITALLKEAKPLLAGPGHTVSPLAWALIAIAILIGVYAIYISTRRNNARHSVRQGFLRIEHALGFFEQALYLRNETLYPADWATYADPRFLDYAHLIVAAAGVAFVTAVFFIALG